MSRSRSRPRRPRSSTRLIVVVVLLLFFVIVPSLLGVVGTSGGPGVLVPPTPMPLGR